MHRSKSIRSQSKSFWAAWKGRIFSKCDLVILILEFLVLSLAGAKLFLLSIEQVDVNKIFSETMRRNTIALEALYENTNNPNPELLKVVHSQIEGASTELMKYIGNRLPSCYFTDGTIPGSNIKFRDLRISVQRVGPASALHNIDLAADIEKTDGTPCDSPSVVSGVADLLKKQTIYGSLIEYLIAVFGTLLFVFKVHDFQFNRKFPSRRRNEQGIPRYLK